VENSGNGTIDFILLSRIDYFCWCVDAYFSFCYFKKAREGVKERSFIEELTDSLHGRIVLMGIGSENRGDDAAGSLIAQALKSKNNFCSIDCSDIPESYTGPAKEFQPDSILFIDAIDFGGQPGDVTFLKPEMLKEIRFNSHHPSLRHVMDYLRSETGSKVNLIGIQPGNIAPGSGVTPAIQSTIEIVKTAITELLDKMSDEGENS